MFKLNIIFIGLILFTLKNSSCVPSFSKIYDNQGPDLSSLSGDSVSSLRFDGLYNLYDTSHSSYPDPEKRNFEVYAICEPLIFINNKNVIWESNILYNDYVPLSIQHYNHYLNPLFENTVGNYIFKNDTIIAKTPISLFHPHGMVINLCNAYFQGVIKDRDTILNWHMIPPYPKVSESINANRLNFLKKPHALYFMEGKELLGLDSLYKERIKQKSGKK